jgi:transposase
MERRAKVELFEQMRREYEFGVGTIRGVAEQFGVHRRLVRQALQDAMPPERKLPERVRPKLGPVQDFIDRILETDQKAPRKQRHTAHRIFVRTQEELPNCEVSEATVRRYVRFRKQALGLLSRDPFVPQAYSWGEEGQVDWYEATAELGGERQKIQVFAMRSMASGGAFHRAYPRATQQALLEGHERAFSYFGGVFRRLRYDNLASAVKKILRGYEREQTARLIAFRSHWKFEAVFCTPGEAHEKGGVEGEAGYFRRNHWVPIPQAKDLEDLNQQLLLGCEQDQQRVIGDRSQSVGVGMRIEREHLLPWLTEGFDLAEVSFASVDSQSCVRVRTNRYSVPLRVGMRVQVKVLPAHIEMWHEGRLVARHERCYQRQQEILDLEHYLEVLERKPGALAGSKPLEQWRRQGRWPASYDRLWQRLKERQGQQPGTREMIELLKLGSQQGWDRLERAVTEALSLECWDAAAIRYLMTAEWEVSQRADPLELGSLARYERPLPEVIHYDQLLAAEVAS